MKKEEVYKLIEYNGIYDDKVKSNLKKLIKEYHPDKNKRDKNTIEIIYEVKKELESNKVSYKKKKEKNDKDELVKKERFISEQECLESIIRLKDIENGNNSVLIKMYGELALEFKKYRSTYQKLFSLKNKLCKLNDEKNKYATIRLIILLISLMMFFLLIIDILYIKSNIFAFLLLILIVINLCYCIYNKKNDSIEENIINISFNIEKVEKNIMLIQKNIDDLSNEIRSLERKNTSVKNDIRFYKNMKE